MDLQAGNTFSIQQLDFQQSILIQNCHLPPEEAISRLIQVDRTSPIIPQNIKIFGKKTKVQVTSAQDIDVVAKNQNSQKINPYFLSPGVLVNAHGGKFQTTILFTKRRFCHFDTKGRLVRFLPIQNIRSIVLCKRNPNMFVIRPKNIHQLRTKQHIMQQMAFSTRKRYQMLRFLYNLNNYNNIQIIVKDEKDIFLTLQERSINLYHSVAGINSPFRLSLSCSSILFGQFQQQGMFTSRYQSIIMIQQTGIFIFQGNQTLQLDHDRKFLYYLPIQQLKTNIRQDSKQAPGRKLRIYYNNPSYIKCYNIIFASKQILKTFIKQVEKQKYINNQFRQKMAQKSLQLFQK